MHWRADIGWKHNERMTAQWIWHLHSVRENKNNLKSRMRRVVLSYRSMKTWHIGVRDKVSIIRTNAFIAPILIVCWRGGLMMPNTCDRPQTTSVVGIISPFHWCKRSVVHYNALSMYSRVTTYLQFCDT